MKYFPILEELFESDTVMFLLIGVVIAAIAGLRCKKQKKLIAAIVTSVLVYGICELLSNMPANFMMVFILLFVGTAAIGCGIGFCICLFIRLCISRKDGR